MRIGTLTLLAVAVLATGGCDQKSAAPGGAAAPAAVQHAAAPAAAPAAAAPATEAGSDVLATAGNKTITRADVEASVKSELGEVEAARYKILRGGVDELVATALFEQEATARGVSLEQLQQTEIVEKVPAPSDDDVKKLYEDNKEQLGGQSFDEVKEKLVEYMKSRSAQGRYTEYIAELKKKYPTKIALRPPTVDVAVGELPPLGPADAKVTIIEFSDYECPFCKRAEASVEQVKETYGDKVRIAYRNYPLPFHQSARPAAQAALCANEQGKFWAMHDKLMAAKDLSAANLQQIASDVGLDRKKFDECVAAERGKEMIEQDLAAGQAAGVNGTPAFFINGRLLDGAQPFEKFQEIIDEELEAHG
ncbi:DsbA family protein [bacterium]|nr:DsbA family protein [bacterium]